MPGEEADEGVDPRIDLAQQKVQARGEWRPRAYGVDAIRFWFGASDYKHDELARHDGDEFEVGSRFSNREQEGRVEVQHAPMASSLGELTGAIGIQIGHRQTRGQSFEGESLLEPARTNSLAAFWFEELKATNRLSYQAALRVERTNVDGFGWTDVTDPNAPDVFNGERNFVPISASLGMLYQLGFETTARLTAQYAERAPMPPSCFPRASTRPLERSRSEIQTWKKNRHSRSSRPSTRQRTVPLRCHGVLYPLPGLHLPRRAGCALP